MRYELYGRGRRNPYVKGDLIVGNDMYAPIDPSMPVFYNGEDMIVEIVNEEMIDEIPCWALWCKGKDVPLYVVKEEGYNEYTYRISQLKGRSPEDQDVV